MSKSKRHYVDIHIVKTCEEGGRGGCSQGFGTAPTLALRQKPKPKEFRAGSDELQDRERACVPCLKKTYVLSVIVNAENSVMNIKDRGLTFF